VPAGIGAIVYLLASFRLRIDEVSALVYGFTHRLPFLGQSGGRFRA
jgi:hypothetical protein